MKKTYINPEVAIIAVRIDKLLQGGSDNDKDGGSIETIGTGEGTASDGIYWGSSKESSLWDGWED